MRSLFEVNSYTHKENKKITVSVYGVRTYPADSYNTQFLVYYNGFWTWTDATKYTPIGNKYG
jgi:hypothetical protein